MSQGIENVFRPPYELATVAASLKTQFDRYLAQNGLGSTVEMNYQHVDEIPRDPATKKVRQIVSRVPPPLLPPATSV